MNFQIIEDEPIKKERRATTGRGHVAHPELLQLKVSKDGTRGGLVEYPDTAHNRKVLIHNKWEYNAATSGSFAGMHFVHRYETRHGEPKIIIQRIA